MKKSSLYSLILSFCVLGAEAQTNAIVLIDVPSEKGKSTTINNLAQQEVNLEQHLWFNSSNSAGMAFQPLNQYHNVSFDAFYNEGNFKLSQKGHTEKGLIFNTEGTAQYKKLFLWGAFKFDNNFTNGSNYNALLYEPSFDMPYYAADFNVSHWKRQNYEMGFRMGTPIAQEKIALGLEANYTSKVGAKQIDPRVETYRHNIDVRPSMVWNFNAVNRAGLTLYYQHYNERCDPSVENYSKDQDVAIMRGLGFYTLGKVGGNTGLKDHIYTGNQYGASLQYGLSLSQLELLADLKFSKKIVDVIQQPKQPKYMGTTDGMLINADVQALFGRNKNQHIKLSFSMNSTDGIEYIQSFNSDPAVQSWIIAASNEMSFYTQNKLDITYDVMTGMHPDLGYRWKFGANASLFMLSEMYYIPQSTFDANDVFAEIFAKRHFSIGENASLLMGISGGYNYALSGSYIYTGSNRGTNMDIAILSNYYPGDLNIYLADFVSGSFHAALSVKTKSLASFYLKAEVNYRKPLSIDSDRLSSNASVGYMF